MKVTKEQLYKIIQEEIVGVLEEWRKGDPSKTRPSREDDEAHRGTPRRTPDPKYGDLEGIEDFKPVFEEDELKEEEEPIVEKWKGKSEIKKLDKYGKEEMTKAELCDKRGNLKDKKKRTAKQGKELKRINFAIRSRQPGKKFGKVKC